MQPTAFLDTNIILRHLLQDHPDHSPRSTAYLSRVEKGELRVATAITVVFETVFTLEKVYRQPKAKIHQAVLPLLLLPGIHLPKKRYLKDVFALYERTNVSFADAYHAVLALDLGISEIVSFDRGFDRIPGVLRVEPN